MRLLLPVLSVMFVLVPSVWASTIDGSTGFAPVAIPVSASMPEGDAAARHARRTACLKEAKVRKLVGAQKASFLKECFASS